MPQEGALLLQGSGSKLCPNPMRPEYPCQAKMTGQQSTLMAIPRDRVAVAQGPACCQASQVQALTLGPVGSHPQP